MKKDLSKRIISLICLFSMVLSIIAPAKVAYAKSIPNIIQGFEINDNNGNPLNHAVDQFEDFRIVASFTLPDAEINAGDITVLQLPDLLSVNSQDIELKDGNNVIATTKVDFKKKTITLTYTEYAASRSGITGKFEFVTRLNPEIAKEPKAYEVVIEEEGKPILAGEVTYKIPARVAPNLAKSGSKGGKSLGAYLVAINRSGRGFENAVIVDRMFSEKITIVPGSFKIEKGEHKWVGNGWKLLSPDGSPAENVTDQFTIEMDSDNRGFNVNMGDIEPGVGYYIRYNATVSYEPDNNEEFYNDIRIEENGSTIEERRGRFTYRLGAGEASGYTFSASLLKTDDAGMPLPGAEFKIVRDSSGKDVAFGTTDNEGKLTFKDLLRTEYTIIETKAPEGFQLSTKEYKIKADDFDENNHVHIGTIINKETLDYAVKKIWDDEDNVSGLRPKEITVNLYRSIENGPKEFVEKHILTGESTDYEWTYTFEDLLVRDENGNYYEYHVEEEFTDQMSQDGYIFDGDGNTIVNKRETVDLIGEKTWDHGSNPESERPTTIQVELWKTVDGVETLVETKDVTGTGVEEQWDFEFFDLPKHENGKEIIYSVKEIKVPGYLSNSSIGTAGTVSIKNTFIEPVVVELEATKYLENELSATEFNFEVKNAAEEVVATGKNDSKGNIKFTGINLPKVGEYKFTIHEVKGADEGFIYDTKVYNAEVAVTFNETTGKLEVTSIHYTDAAGNELSGVSFYNLINTVDVNGTKTWNHGSNPEDERPTTIQVELWKTVDGVETLVETKDVTGTGVEEKWDFEFYGLPKYENGKEIIYSVKEINIPNYTSVVSGMDITNTYVEPIKVDIGILKKLIGKDLRANQFKFNLVGISDNTKGIKKFVLNDKNGNALFNKLIFDEVGVYKYEVYETKGRDKKIVYDDTRYTIEVKVSFDKKSNSLISEVAVNGELKTESPIILDFKNYTTDSIIKGDKNKEKF